MGLFLGMSVLTVIETIILLVKLAWMALHSKRRRYEARKRRVKQASLYYRDTLNVKDAEREENGDVRHEDALCSRIE